MNHLKLARALANLLDNQFQIFNFKFGLDPILGLIPWVGDTFSFLLGLYIVWIAKQSGLPQSKLNLMIINIILDFMIGLIPVLGDILDFVVKSNSKNLEILEEYLDSHQIIEGEIISS